MRVQHVKKEKTTTNTSRGGCGLELHPRVLRANAAFTLDTTCLEFFIVKMRSHEMC